MSRNYRVAVIGGGVVGLSSALCMASHHPNLDVTVIADKALRETTSIGPPGLFRPSLHSDNIEQWARKSYSHYMELTRSADASLAGVQLLSGYVLGDDMPFLQSQERKYGDIVANFRWLKQQEMSLFPVPFKYGYFCTTVLAQSHIYVPWLAEQARLKGCKFVQQQVGSLMELSDSFDVLVNCSGLGARRLVPDESVIPVRGISLKVSAPWIKHFVMCDRDSTYIMPGIEHVFLGTVREENSWRTDVLLSERQRILDRCAEIIPSLKAATFIDEWAGLRPYRPVPRLELEHLDCKDRTIPVIHNYGHGGNGITLSWGTAMNVNELLTEHIRMKAKL